MPPCALDILPGDAGMPSPGPAKVRVNEALSRRAPQDRGRPTHPGRSSGARGLRGDTAGASIGPPQPGLQPPGPAAPGPLTEGSESPRRAACPASAPSPGARTSGGRRHPDRRPEARRSCAASSPFFPRPRLLTCQMAKKMSAAVSSSASM